jgi:hypothetical protein
MRIDTFNQKKYHFFSFPMLRENIEELLCLLLGPS